LQHDGSLVLRRSTRYPFAPDIAFQLTETDVGLVGVAVSPVGAAPTVPDRVGGLIGEPIGVLICAIAACGTASAIAIIARRMEVSPQYATVALTLTGAVDTPVRKPPTIVKV
jgi:hypothetical protein